MPNSIKIISLPSKKISNEVERNPLKRIVSAHGMPEYEETCERVAEITKTHFTDIQDSKDCGNSHDRIVFCFPNRPIVWGDSEHCPLDDIDSE